VTGIALAATPCTGCCRGTSRRPGGVVATLSQDAALSEIIYCGLRRRRHRLSADPLLCSSACVGVNAMTLSVQVALITTVAPLQVFEPGAAKSCRGCWWADRVMCSAAEPPLVIGRRGGSSTWRRGIREGHRSGWQLLLRRERLGSRSECFLRRGNSTGSAGGPALRGGHRFRFPRCSECLPNGFGTACVTVSVMVSAIVPSYM